MVEERDMGRGIIVGGIGGSLLTAAVAAWLAGRPVKAEEIPFDKRFDYLIECQTAIVALLGQLVESNQAIAEKQGTVIELLQQLLAAQGVVVEIPGEERVITVITQWKAAEPEEIFKEAIRTTDPVYTDKMVDWRQGKRIYFFVQSTLNQDVSVQVIGNMTDAHEDATDINTAKACPAGDNISIGPAWDHWCPYIGIKITVSIAPTSGMLTISAVRQE